jgi:hypothetical protein
MPDIHIKLGGSYRKYIKQKMAFKEAGIPLEFLYNVGRHYKYALFSMPDTPAARELLKTMGGTITKQYKPLEDSPIERML